MRRFKPSEDKDTMAFSRKQSQSCRSVQRHSYHCLMYISLSVVHLPTEADVVEADEQSNENS